MSGPRSDSEWREALALLAPAPPDLIAGRQLRRRTDSKFLMPPSAARALLPLIARDYALITNGHRGIATYRTLYFDTPALDLFHAQRRGRRVRHKVRIRHYPDRLVSFLEVKTRRTDLETRKALRPRDYGDDVLSAADRAFAQGETEIGQPLQPQAWTTFQRLTLLGLRVHERVTIDLNLEVSGSDRCRGFPGVAVVEVKQWPYSRGTPVMAALRAGGWREGWLSKYCAAIAFTRPDARRNRLLPGLRVLERSVA
jgi:hypothetical protein